MKKLIILFCLIQSCYLFSTSLSAGEVNVPGGIIHNNTAIGSFNTGIPDSGILISTVGSPDYNSSSVISLYKSSDYSKSPYLKKLHSIDLNNPYWYFLGLCSYSSGKQVWSQIPLEQDYDPSTIENDLDSISTNIKWQNGEPILWYIGQWNDGLNTGIALYYYNQLRDQQLHSMNIQGYSFHTGDIVDIDSTPDFDAMLLSSSANNCAVTYFDGKNCHPYTNMPTISSSVTPLYISGKFRNSNTSTVMYAPSVVYVLSDGSIYFYKGDGSFMSAWTDLNSSSVVGKTFPKGSISNISVNWAMVPAPQTGTQTIYPQIMITMTNGVIYYFDGTIADGWSNVYQPSTTFLAGYKYLNVNWNEDNSAPSLFAISSDTDNKGFIYCNVRNGDFINDTSSSSSGIFDISWNNLGTYPNYLQLSNNTMSDFNNYSWTDITDSATQNVDSIVSVDFQVQNSNGKLNNGAVNFLAINGLRGNSVVKFSQKYNNNYIWSSSSPFPSTNNIIASSFIANSNYGQQGLVMLDNGDIYYTAGGGIWKDICSLGTSIKALSNIKANLYVTNWPLPLEKYTSAGSEPFFTVYIEGSFSGTRYCEVCFYSPITETFYNMSPAGSQIFNDVSASYIGSIPMVIAINDSLDYVYKNSGIHLNSIGIEAVFTEGISAHSISWDANGDPFIVIASNDSKSIFKTYDGTGGCVSSNFNILQGPSSNGWTSKAVKISSFWSGTAIYFVAGFSDGSLCAYNGNSSQWYKLPSSLSDPVANIVVNWPKIGGSVTWNEYPSLVASDDKNIEYIAKDGGTSLNLTTEDLSSAPSKIYAFFSSNSYPSVVTLLNNGEIISFN